MQPDVKEKRDKGILAYVRELDKLRVLTWNAPLIKLAKPYQNGWTKYFILRDDYTRRTDAQAHVDILKEIGTECFCRKQEFIDRQGKPYGPGLRIIGRNEWESLGWPEFYKKYFSYGLHYQKQIYGRNNAVEGYKFSRDFCFIEALKPHFITHTRTIYPDIESRKAEINNLFDREQYWKRYSRLKGQRKGSSDWRLAKDHYMEALGTKEIEEYDKS